MLVPDCQFSFFSHPNFQSGNFFLIAPFPDHCLLLPFYCDGCSMVAVDIDIVCQGEQFSLQEVCVMVGCVCVGGYLCSLTSLVTEREFTMAVLQ